MTCTGQGRQWVRSGRGTPRWFLGESGEVIQLCRICGQEVGCSSPTINLSRSVPWRLHSACTGERRIYILPQILGSLPEVIRSWCAHHHHHHHHHHKVFARPFEVERSLSRSQKPEPSGGRPWEKRHQARGTPRAQPRDVRSAGRDTWNLTGEALGGPRKRSWRR